MCRTVPDLWNSPGFVAQTFVKLSAIVTFCDVNLGVLFTHKIQEILGALAEYARLFRVDCVCHFFSLGFARFARQEFACEFLRWVRAALVVKGLDAQLPSFNHDLVDVRKRSIRMDHEVQGLSLIQELLTVGGLDNDLDLCDFTKRLEYSLFLFR
ncbi:hypothetical protein D3C71_1745380 [compost metagenome]